MTDRWQRIARVRCPYDHHVAIEVWTDGQAIRERRSGDPLPDDWAAWDAMGRGHAWCTDPAHAWTISPRDQSRIDDARADYTAHLERCERVDGLAQFTPWSGRDVNVHAKRTLVRTPFVL